MLAAPIFGLLFAVACSSPLAGNQSAGTAPTLDVRVVKSFPHDPKAFCQGLIVEGETLYEGTGRNGESNLRRVDLQTGKVQAYQPLNENYFGEGITELDGMIYQLTWKRGVCIVWDKTSLRGVRFVGYSGEGWGLTDDGQHLYMSDGSSTIRVLDPKSEKNFKTVRRIRVKDGRKFVRDLNELEFVDGHILANVWYEDRIAKIDPKTGNVVAWIDCSGVYPASSRPKEHVLNGIAYDEESKRLFITGKYWPRLFEIEVQESE